MLGCPVPLCRKLSIIVTQFWGHGEAFCRRCDPVEECIVIDGSSSKCDLVLPQGPDPTDNSCIAAWVEANSITGMQSGLGSSRISDAKAAP
eukprot:scaffold2691_cov417-Prasinococcus_capsulatus_cf.AAC.15